MSDLRFDIIFRGDIVLGNRLDEVKQRMAKLFKVDAAKIEALFTGAAVPLKRNLDQAAAEKYRAVLAKAGAQVDVCAQPREIARPASRVANKPDAKGAPPATTVDAASLSLAPAGTDVLTPDERAPQIVNEVNTDSLSLRPAEGDLLDAAEKPLPIAGLVFDFSELVVVEVGEDLLRADEKPLVATVAVDIRGLELAPAGSDLEQLRPAEPASPPDTSGLSLADD